MTLRWKSPSRVTEALHYDELDLSFTSCKVIKMKGEFKDAEKRKLRFTVINYMNIMNFSSDFIIVLYYLEN